MGFFGLLQLGGARLKPYEKPKKTFLTVLAFKFWKLAGKDLTQCTLGVQYSGSILVFNCDGK
jgi:hypothetical protein